MYLRYKTNSNSLEAKLVFLLGDHFWNSSSQLPQEAAEIPRRRGQGFLLTRNVGFLAILQGPHYPISAHMQANRNLL